MSKGYDAKRWATLSISKQIPPKVSQKITFDSELPVGSLGLDWAILLCVFKKRLDMALGAMV